MRHLEAASEDSREKVVFMFRRVTDGLKPGEIDALTRKMVLDDLLWSSEQGMDLPFGLKGPDDVVIELRKIDNYLQSRPDLMERLNIRNKERSQLRNAMIENNVLTEEQLRNPHYFRHQVLEYASIRNRVDRARKVKTTYWHPRGGSEKDINANFFQAEADWMFRAHHDIATAKFLRWLEGSKYQKKAAMQRKAKEANKAALAKVIRDELLAAGVAPSMLKSPLGQEDTDANTLVRRLMKSQYFGSLRLEKLLPENKTPLFEAYRGFNRRIAGGIRGIQNTHTTDGRATIPTHLLEAYEALIAPIESEEFEPYASDLEPQGSFMDLVAWLVENGTPDQKKAAATVLSAIGKRRAWVAKTAIPDVYVNPQSAKALITAYGDDEYVAWQPDSYDGKTRAVHMLTAKTVPEHVIERVMDDLADIYSALESGKLRAADPAVHEAIVRGVREVRAVGGPKKELIIPDYLAESLNTFRDADAEFALDSMARLATSYWKQWVLFNPRRFFKYYLNNMTGDIDAIIANKAMAPIAKQLPRAFKDMRKLLYGDGRENLPAALQEAMEKGVIHTGLTAQEIHNLQDFDVDSDFHLKIDSNLFMRGTRKYFDAVMTFARWRENAVRYAAYLHYREAFLAGKTMEEIGYGASPPWMVRGIEKAEDRAARMARDALGDYGNLGQTGRWLRTRLIPFWSWMESNSRRYTNLFRNAYLYGRDVSAAKGVTMGAAAAGGLLVRLAMFTTLVQVWNLLLFGDEEDNLDTEERIRLHLNLGQWDMLGGDQVTLRFQGALSDFAGWFGLEDAGALASEVQKGRANVMDVVSAMAKAPVNRTVNSVNPIYKLPLELWDGSVFFPDVMNPRPLYDPYQHVARTFSVEEGVAQAQKHLLGVAAPTRGWLHHVMTSFVYTRTPGEIAFQNTRSRAYRWLSRVKGKDIPRGTSERNRAYYAWRKSVLFDDSTSEKLALKKLRELGVSGTNLRSSLESGGPLGMLSKQERKEFLATLSPKEHDQMRRGMAWYRGVLP